jgi:hypothetical protein
MGLFTNCKIFVGAYDITGRSNEVNVTLDKEIKDRSYFGAGAAHVKGTGLEMATITAKGYHDSSIDIERTYHGTDTPVSFFIPASSGAAVVAGDRAIFFKALEAGYARGAPFGDDALFNFAAVGDQLGYPVGVGYVLNPGLVAVTADNTPAASIVELTAVTASQYLYGVLHVTSVSTADTIIVTIQSDSLVGFGSPATQITFASKAAIGSEYAVRVAGPITDTFWRAYADVTVTGEPCAITFACAMAIR